MIRHWGERKKKQNASRTGSVDVCVFLPNRVLQICSLRIPSYIIFRAFVTPQPLLLSVPLDGPPDAAEDSTPGEKRFVEVASS